MAKYGPADFVVSLDDTGGSPVDMTQYVDDVSSIDITAIIEESHGFGKSWAEQLYSGVKRMEPVTFSGFFDDTASTGPDVVFNAPGETRTMLLTLGGSKTVSTEAIITTYTRTPGRNASTRYSVVLTPTGTVTEA